MPNSYNYQSNLPSFGRYRKKPVVIEAVRYEGSIWELLNLASNKFPWLSEALFTKKIYQGTNPNKLVIKTLEGNHICNPGDYIVQGVKGELYPVKPDIFDQTYDFILDDQGTGV